MVSTLDLLLNTVSYTHDKAFLQAQTHWADTLDRLVNQTYKAADRDARKLIASWRLSLDNLIAERTALLDLLYEGEPEVPAELVMNLYRDALVDACGYK